MKKLVPFLGLNVSSCSSPTDRRGKKIDSSEIGKWLLNARVHPPHTQTHTQTPGGQTYGTCFQRFNILITEVWTKSSLCFNC